MPKDLEFESILELARSAYEEKTGDELNHETPVNYATFSNVAGWRLGNPV